MEDRDDVVLRVLERIQDRLSALEAKLDVRMGALEVTMKQEFTSLHSRMTAFTLAHRVDTASRLAALETRLEEVESRLRGQ